MDRRAKLVAAALLSGVAFNASAFYSGLTPPSGWTAGGGPGGQMAGAIANAQASSKFTGSVTKIPVAMRYAAGAGRFAVRSILGGGVIGAGIIAAEWLAENCFEKQGGQWVRTCFPDGSGQQQSDGFEYRFDGALAWRSDAMAACVDRAASATAGSPVWNFEARSVDVGQFPVCRTWDTRKADGSGGSPNSFAGERRQSPTCPAGWYITPAGCIQTPQPTPVSPAEIEEEMAPKPIPPGLPEEIPKTPLPIEIPTINPDPANPTQPKPWREPAGNPVPIPDTQPQRYKQPWTEITPAPTQTDPWRVDVQPKSTETTSPNPVQPDGIGPSPSPLPTDGKPEEKQPDLCEKNPDIVACQKLGSLDALPVPNENRQLSIVPDSGWGPGSASCPAPKTATVMGVHLELPFTMLCDFATGIRPLLLAFAWLSAALTFMGLSRRD